MRRLLLDSDCIVLNESWMADVDETRLHVLYDCDRIVIVQRVDDAQVVSLRLSWLDLTRISDSVHLKVVSLKNLLSQESVIEESDIFFLYENIVRSF